MKTSSNLAGSLRTLFAALRVLVAVSAVILLLGLGAGWCIQAFDGPVRDGRFTVSIDDIHLRDTQALGLDFKTSGGTTGRVGMNSLQGNLRLDLFSNDRAMSEAALLGGMPQLAILFGVGWFLLGLLRDLCANFARGEVLSDNNLRLTRRIGWTFVISAFVNIAAKVWANWVIGGYLKSHVLLASAGGARPMEISLSGGTFSLMDDLITGLLILVLSEAFRQGLALKAENDLTV